MKSTLICLLFASLCLSSCSTFSSSSRSSALQHVVLCWLKDSGNAEHRRQIIEVSETFRKIPGVASVRVGQVVPSERPIVDDSYDVGIIVAVKDEVGLAEYLAHPIHQQAKNEVLLPLVEKVLVYDFKESR